MDALHRMRAIRRDSYRCQHRTERGLLCGVRSGHAVYLVEPPRSDDDVVTRCLSHLEG